jgi:nucleoid-associated protein YgaU
MTLNINITISHQWPEGQPGWATKLDLENTERKIMAGQQEAIETLQGMLAQLQKVTAESTATRQAVDTLNAKVAELEAAIANANIPQAVMDKINEVKAAIQVVDDVVPD